MFFFCTKYGTRTRVSQVENLVSSPLDEPSIFVNICYSDTCTAYRIRTGIIQVENLRYYSNYTKAASLFSDYRLITIFLISQYVKEQKQKNQSLFLEGLVFICFRLKKTMIYPVQEA